MFFPEERSTAVVIGPVGCVDGRRPCWPSGAAGCGRGAGTDRARRGFPWTERRPGELSPGWSPVVHGSADVRPRATARPSTELSPDVGEAVVARGRSATNRGVTRPVWPGRQLTVSSLIPRSSTVRDPARRGRVILDHTTAASGPEWSPNGRWQQVSDRAPPGVSATGVAGRFCRRANVRSKNVTRGGPAPGRTPTGRVSAARAA